MASDEDVYCTLVNSDNYLPGAAVLAHSLRDAGTTRKLAVLVTVASLRYDTLTELKALYDYVIPVDRITNPNPANLYLIDRGDLLYAFTKINLWRLTQFRKVVYIDADVVALRAPDELFDTKADFAAASDIGWPDIFNTGVMALKPDMGTYWALHTQASSGDSFDGADQGLLNQYYEHKPWHRLPFTYNCTPSASYQYEPAYRYYKSGISLVHFIGAQKPWMKGRTAGQQGANAYKELVNRWWGVYDRHYKVPSQPGYSGRTNVVQAKVAGEAYNPSHSQLYAEQHSTTPAINIEPPPGDPADAAEKNVHENVDPTPTHQQRQFSAPQNEWDATRAPPPTQSHPEAINFPTTTYEFTHDPRPFQPPQAYPEPPKDMWFEVPKERPLPPAARPKPIFPWEDRPLPKPTRKFIEDSALAAAQATGAAGQEGSNDSPPSGTPSIKINDDLPQTMEPVQRNAWDDVGGIDAYVRQLNQWQRLKGKLQVLNSNNPQPMSPNEATTPTDAKSPTGGPPGSEGRRQSLKLTDFPTATERPSLPVTPAPVRRNMFWGEERNIQGQMPAAEGVPDQSDWNPNERLESLRLGSLTLDPSQLILPAKNVPRREMPRSSVDIGEHPALIPDPDGAAAISPGSSAARSHVHFGEEPVDGVVEVPLRDESRGLGVRFGGVRFDAPAGTGRAPSPTG